MSEAIKKAIEDYRKHLDSCGPCSSSMPEFCAEGRRKAAVIGNAQAAEILASAKKPTGGIQ